MGPRVLFREKDNPERRYDYLDEIIGTIGKGTLGLTVNCARCHNHKFDPISQKDYYALEASLFGYVETEVPLAPKAEAEAYLAKNAARSTRKIADLQAADRTRSSSPTASGCSSSRSSSNFPRTSCSVLSQSPKTERTPGEQLLATQVLEAVSVAGAEVDRVAARRTSRAKKKRWRRRSRRSTRQRPTPLPMAEIVTDGDYRFVAARRGRRHDQLSEVPHPGAGRRHASCTQGPGRYQVPPSYFLIRGDVESHGSQMKPGFIDVITYGNPPTEIPRPDGRTSGRRLALAQWIASPQNPLTARVIVNRLWQKHFGRGIVADARQLRQDGRAADASGAARLAGGRVHEPRLEHQADHQADDDVGGLPDGVGVRRRRRRDERSGEPLSVALPPAAARRRDRARQHAGGRRQHQPGGRRRADLSVHRRRTCWPASTAASG